MGSAFTEVLKLLHQWLKQSISIKEAISYQVLLIDIHEFSVNFIFFKTHKYCHLSDTSNQIIRVQINLIFHILKIHAGCLQWATVSASKPVNFWKPRTNLTGISLFKKHSFSGTQISNLITPAQSQKKLYDYAKGRPGANLQHHFQERLSFSIPMIQGLII